MARKKKTYRNLKPLPEAQDIFFSRFGNSLMTAETVPVRQARDRLLVKPVKAVRSVPAYNAAAVDGMAVRASSTFSAFPETPVILSIGSEAIQVDTGDPLPEGTDSVVMIEKIEITGNDSMMIGRI